MKLFKHYNFKYDVQADLLHKKTSKNLMFTVLFVERDFNNEKCVILKVILRQIGSLSKYRFSSYSDSEIF
jgi:hypothetical protein